MTCPWNDFTLTYKFKSTNPTKYASFSFNKNGGTGSAPSISLSTTNNAVLLEIPDYNITKNGYVLAGWSFNGTTYSPGRIVSFSASYVGESYTLTAVWVEAGNAWIYYGGSWRRGVMWIYNGGWKKTTAKIYSGGWK